MKDKIINGDALTKLKKLKAGSVDLVCTDPPYGYSFMGKDWDKAVPKVEVWQECLRVLKPGAFCFVMSAPRSDVQMHMIENLTKAGFRMDFTPIYWTYASGFPKAGNIGKLVDKRNGRTPTQEFREYLNKARQSKGYTLKKVNELLGYGSKGGGMASYWLGQSNIKFYGLPSIDDYSKIKEVLSLDDRFDELIEKEEADRQVIGKGKHYSPGRNPINQNNTVEFNKNNHVRVETAHSTDQAKALDGSYGGFQPKPAVEVVLVAMKPLSEKTYVDQAMKNGKGVTWLDDGRIPTGDTYHYARKGGSPIHDGGENVEISASSHAQGRFPANLLVSDDVLNDGREIKPSFREGDRASNNDGIVPWNKGRVSGRSVKGAGYSDGGSFSRYFDIDKWWNERTKDLPESVRKTFPFLIVPKAGKAEKNKGLDQMPERLKKTHMRSANGTGEKNFEGGFPDSITKNHHPTVKPLKLMSYLVTLGSRPGDTVLDPFVGSGTTCLAAKLLNRESIGIELDKEYVEIAEARLKAVGKQQSLV